MAKKITFRGASFRHLDVRTGDNKAFVRAHISCDITRELADYFGWDIYKDGRLIHGLIGSTKLEGDLFLQELSFQVNGTKDDPVEMIANTAEDFQLTRKKTETGDGVETNLRFLLTTMAVTELIEYFVNMGTADGVLKLELAKATAQDQATLEDQPHLQTQEPEAEDAQDSSEEPKPTGKGKSRSGTLAPKLVMEKIQ